MKKWLLLRGKEVQEKYKYTYFMYQYLLAYTDG